MFWLILIIGFVGIASYQAWSEKRRTKEAHQIHLREVEATAEYMRTPASDEYAPQDWRSRRYFVLNRDGNKCVKCGTTSALEVHHVNPRKNAWNHSSENLQTLCVDCHSKEHGKDFRKRAVRAKVAATRRYGKLTTFHQVKSKKSHVCTRCGNAIEVSTNYYRGGSMKLCEDCFMTSGTTKKGKRYGPRQRRPRLRIN